MKVTVNNTTPTQEKPFPKLMCTSDGYVVFFLQKNEGICLQKAASSCDKVGNYSEGWNMDGFTDFNGSITLSND